MVAFGRVAIQEWDMGSHFFESSCLDERMGWLRAATISEYSHEKLVEVVRENPADGGNHSHSLHFGHLLQPVSHLSATI